MYIDFSNSNDNIMATSTFHIVAKYLDTLLKKYEEKGTYKMAILDLIDLKKVNKELQALNIINDVMATINLDSEEKTTFKNLSIMK